MEDKEEIFMYLYLNIKNIKNIIKNIYNSDYEIIFNQIILKLENYFKKNKLITSNLFLCILIDDFHISRENFEEIKSFNEIPFFIINKMNFLICQEIQN